MVDGEPVPAASKARARSAELGIALALTVVGSGCTSTTALQVPDDEGFRSIRGPHVRVQHDDTLVLHMREGNEVWIPGPVYARRRGADAVIDSSAGRYEVAIEQVEAATLRRPSVVPVIAGATIGVAASVAVIYLLVLAIEDALTPDFDFDSDFDD